MLAVTLRLGLVLYAKTSVPEELVGVYFSPSSWTGSALALLGPLAELLAWSVVFRLGLACWRVEEVDDVEDADDGVERTPLPEVADGLLEPVLPDWRSRDVPMYALFSSHRLNNPNTRRLVDALSKNFDDVFSYLYTATRKDSLART